jgi:signal transduction histidine kinase
VSDNGKGIDSRYFEKIFKLFESLEHESVGGAGIGLRIVRQVVEMHGGRIWLTSEIGTGSKFYFTLPKNTRNHAA